MDQWKDPRARSFPGPWIYTHGSQLSSRSHHTRPSPALSGVRPSFFKISSTAAGCLMLALHPVADYGVLEKWVPSHPHPLCPPSAPSKEQNRSPGASSILPAHSALQLRCEIGVWASGAPGGWSRVHPDPASQQECQTSRQSMAGTRIRVELGMDLDAKWVGQYPPTPGPLIATYLPHPGHPLPPFTPTQVPLSHSAPSLPAPPACCGMKEPLGGRGVVLWHAGVTEEEEE